MRHFELDLQCIYNTKPDMSVRGMKGNIYIISFLSSPEVQATTGDSAGRVRRRAAGAKCGAKKKRLAGGNTFCLASCVYGGRQLILAQVFAAATTRRRRQMRNARCVRGRRPTETDLFRFRARPLRNARNDINTRQTPDDGPPLRHADDENTDRRDVVVVVVVVVVAHRSSRSLTRTLDVA